MLLINPFYTYIIGSSWRNTRIETCTFGDIVKNIIDSSIYPEMIR